MYNVETTRQFRRRLNGLPVPLQQRIVDKIDRVAANPYAAHANVTKLQGRDGYRLRVGDWRIIYDLIDDRLVMMVLELDARGGIY